MMGYGPEDKNAVLELTNNYGVTEYDKGDAYAQVDRSSSPFWFFILLQSAEEVFIAAVIVLGIVFCTKKMAVVFIRRVILI